MCVCVCVCVCVCDDECRTITITKYCGKEKVRPARLYLCTLLTASLLFLCSALSLSLSASCCFLACESSFSRCPRSVATCSLRSLECVNMRIEVSINTEEICVCKTQITWPPPLFSSVAPAPPVSAVAALALPVA